jgi:hypothetical protein
MQWILVGILLLVVVVLWFATTAAVHEGYRGGDYHVVCARYQKPVDFLDGLDVPYSVLEKHVDVPNIAHEATTYLHYIIENYNDLPENVIFIHDENESWHHEGKLTDNLQKWIESYETETNQTYYEFNHTCISRDGTNMDADMYEKNAAFRDFWDTCLLDTVGDYHQASPVAGKCCAQFIVSRDRIRQKPREFYQRLYQWLMENTQGEGNGDTENRYSGWWTSRYMEWTWRFMF